MPNGLSEGQGFQLKALSFGRQVRFPRNTEPAIAYSPVLAPVFFIYSQFQPQ
jgi:hypothetical protein